MTSFQGGPAQGKNLMIRRAPYFLRVVVKGNEVDALDQLDDKPAADEMIHVYRCVGEVGTVHLNIRGGKGGFFPMATYQHLAEQPADEEVRETAAWQAWTRANAPARIETMATEHGEPRDK